MMFIAGRIDAAKFKLAGFEVLTEDVVLTEPQIQHIREDHPGDYDKYQQFIPAVLAEPDYIVEANKADSAVLLKHIEQDEIRFQLVLRLKMERDPKEFRNSIITFWRIEEKRYLRYLRTKKVLYKQE